MPIIYYGIVGNFARENIDKWTDITGIPDAFSVKDEKLNNFQKKFLNKYSTSIKH